MPTISISVQMLRFKGDDMTTITAANATDLREIHAEFRGSCPLCGGARLSPALLLPDAEGNSTRIWQCLDCFAHVPETAQTATSDHERAIDQQVAFHEAFWSDCTAESMAALRGDLKRMVELMRAQFGAPAAEDLLVEIGSGRGGLLRALLDHGYRALGCEPSAQLVQLARTYFDLDESVLRHESGHALLDRLEAEGARPRVIILWHVLEHLVDPLQLLSRCARLLREDGGLILQLPLLHSAYVYPEHYFFVTPDTVPVLAERLGGLPCQAQVDAENKFITVCFGTAVRGGEDPTRVGELAASWRAAHARAEPIQTRDLALAHLQDAYQQAGHDLQAVRADLERLNAAHAEAASQLDHAARIDAINVRTIADLSDRLDQQAAHAAEVDGLRIEQARRDDEIGALREQLAALAAQRNEQADALQRQDALLEERNADVAHLESMVAEQQAAHTAKVEGLRIEQARRDDEIRGLQEQLAVLVAQLDEQVGALQRQGALIEERHTDVARLESVIAEQRAQEASRQAELDGLRAALAQSQIVQTQVLVALDAARDAHRTTEAQHGNMALELALARQLSAQKDEALKAQATLIDERWTAMQEMGREISMRDAALAEQAGESAWAWRLVEGGREREAGLRYRLADAEALVAKLDQRPWARVLRACGVTPSRRLADLSAHARSRRFAERSHNRYWWHRVGCTDYVPLIYDFLSPDEWSVLEDWFDDTEKRYESTGEANVPPLSLLFGLISGNGLSRIVQCGHYVGYSTLLLSFLLRRMGVRNGLYSIDIDPEVTAYTKNWMRRAGLMPHARLTIADSADPAQAVAAEAYLGGAPQLVFIDSSHQYAHTLRELDLWYGRLTRGGLIVLHDVSSYAASLDSSNDGGVQRAVNEWCARQGVTALSLNSFVDGGRAGDYPYLDGCGLSVIQKSE
ncbi:methyltransferase domain-containing protein [Burkholderia cepacia]|uniref:class I SAM-dependent methyltransferase n=1 Tax=Burkholderia cepacia TaxID=292 RepID=UPI000CF0EFCD|nr:class I SAM-dependent methyltransferase [Burkholderia cepacia]KAB1596031.1 methyltransferase domain-containing protein [Burkholderia cepacia]